MTDVGRPPGPGLRERKKQQTRELLAATALRLFSARGYDAVTVEDVAAAADVSPRTFFRYFASKDDVLFPDDDRDLQRLRAALAARPPEEPVLRAVRSALLELADGFEDQRAGLLARAQIISSTPSLQSRSLVQATAFESALTTMVATRLGVEPGMSLRPPLVAACVFAALRVAVSRWLDDGGAGDLVALVAESLDLLDGGLAQVETAPS